MKNFGYLSDLLIAVRRRMGLMILLFIGAMVLARTAKAQSIIIDGNPIDWTGKFSDPLFTPKTFVVDRVDALDTGMTGGGSKDDGPISGWQWSAGQVTPAKDNIENAGVLKRGDSLFFFIDRLETSGDANYGFWLFKSPISINPAGGFTGAHTVGDIFVAMTFTQGGGLGTPQVYLWNGTTIQLVPLSPAAAKIATNLTGYTPPWPYSGDSVGHPELYKTGSFLEGFINLDSLGETDLCFTTFMADSRTSQSTSSVIKDIVFGSFATRPTVTVNNDTVCKGTDAHFTATVTGGIPPITFSWNGGSFAAANTFTVTAATTNTVVTVRAQGSNGCISVPDTGALVVKPTPTITATADRTHCNGVTAGAITFSSNPVGASFSWVGTRDVGFGTSGTVNPIPSYTATNTSSVTVTDTVIVTPTLNGCSGKADTFLVTVNPTPTVAAHGDSTYCNGATAGALTFDGTPAGVAFSWTSSVNVGFGTSGTVNPIPSYTATNTSSVTVTATVIVTPSANSCTGKADTFLIIVNPTPSIAAHGDSTYCAGVLAGALTFTNTPPGGTVNWTSSADVGFGTSGTVNPIPAYIAQSGLGVQRIATVIATPTSANGCVGKADTFLITVNPTPGPNAPVPNAEVCNGALVDTIHLASLDPAVTTHWTATADLGFGTSGDGNIPAFLGSNGGGTAIVVTVTVTAASNVGCSSGDTSAFTITINPDAGPNAPVDNIFVCSGGSVDSIDIQGLDAVTTFHWTADVNVGAGLSGTGNIPAFTATVNPGPGNIVATFTVTATSPSGCPGDTTGFQITVYPLPVVEARDTSICAGVSFSLDLLSNPDGGTWTGTGASGTTFNSAGLSAGPHGLLYTYTNGTTGCTNTDSADVTILANPVVVARDTAICAGVSFNLNLLSDPDGGTWTGSGVSGTTFNSAGLSGVIGLFYNFSNGAGCSGSDSAYITINANPTVVARDTSICAGVSFSLNLLSDPDGGTWTGSGVSGTTFNSAGLSGTIGLFYNFTNGSGCSGSDSAYITINPLPTVVARDTSICAGVSFSLNLLSDPDGGTWSGTGASGTTFNSAGLSLGKHGLLYTFTSGAGCTSSDSAYVTLTSCGNVFATFTQGFWGSKNGKHCDGAGTQRNAVSLINYLLNLYGPITVGLPGRSIVIPVTAAVIVNDVMPGGHTPNKLTVGADVTISNVAGSVFATNYLTGGRINNVFLSQVIALRLGTRIIPGLLGFPIVYNPSGNSSFQTCGTSTTNCSTFTVGGGCSCWTLQQSVTRYVTKGGTKTATLADLLSLADSLLGGGLTPGTTVGGYVVPSYANVSDAIDLFNNAFDNFKSFSGSYGCPVPKTPVDAGNDLEAAMRVYPNPTTGTFTIEIPAIDKEAHITIVDLNGRTVMSVVAPANTYTQTQEIDLPRVAPGLYIIHVENDGHMFSKKIMVE